MHGFIATLGMGLIIKGYLGHQLQGNQRQTAVGVPADRRDRRGGPVPVSTIIMLAWALLGALFLSRTRVGNHMFAVGGTEQVARLQRHPARRTRVIVGPRALLGAAGDGRPAAGQPARRRQPDGGSQGGYDLLSIAAVVLGGTLLAGGKRLDLGHASAASLIFAVLDNIMSVMQVNPFMKDVVRGIVIVAAVAVYTGRQVEQRGPASGRAARRTTGGDRSQSAIRIRRRPRSSRPRTPRTGRPGMNALGPW